MKVALLAFVLASASTYGQDDGAWAAQQAMQASQQATQQALQDMETAQQANQQAIQAAQQANDQAMQAANDANQNNYPYFLGRGSGVLSLSVGPGEVKPGTRVRIDFSSADRFAKIYYTTDGWTPTKSSTLYRGPIKIDASTHLEAIAVGRGLANSLLIRADYTVKGSAAPPMPSTALTTNGVLTAGFPIQLETGSSISSATAHVGDNVTILLDEDVKVGDTVVAAKGTPVDAVLTLGVPAKNGAAGELAFEVHSLMLRGQTIPLAGSEMLVGGVAKDAVIEPGRLLTARVTRETLLNP